MWLIKVPWTVGNCCSLLVPIHVPNGHTCIMPQKCYLKTRIRLLFELNIKTATLSLKRNAPWIHWLPLRSRVEVKWPRQGRIWSWEFETGRKKPFPKMTNCSLDILKSPRVCHILEFTKLLKSHCNRCIFGVFCKQCISFGQECMVLNPGVFL